MVKVKVPATTANFGPGFDCMGAALGLYNYVEMEFSKTLMISVAGEGEGAIDTGKGNLIYKAARRIFDELGIRDEIRINQKNNIPLARGLGSSAACVAAGMMAAHRLTGEILAMERIIELATQMEGHPDNIVPALLGGFCLSMLQEEKIFYRKFSLFKDLKFVVGIPEFHLNTRDSRRVLPETVDFQDAVFNISRASLLVAAVIEGDTRDIEQLCKDRLHQPYRSVLVPGMDKILSEAVKKGALASFLSGAGPSVLCITCPEDTDMLGRYMVKTFGNYGIKSTFKVLSSCNRGTQYV